MLTIGRICFILISTKTGENTLKRIIKTAVCFLIIACLTGCSFGVIVNEPPSKDESVTSVTSVTEESTSGVSETASTSPSPTTEKNSTTTTTSTSEKPETTATTKKAKTTTAAAKTTVSSTTAKPKGTTASNCCYLTIEYFKIKDGAYLLNRYKCEYKKGDTVYDILTRSCEKNKIPIGEKSTGYGTYIYSIDNIDENYLGYKKGGWTYTVNGDMVMKSVDKCEVNKGDKIQFSYVIVN